MFLQRLTSFFWSLSLFVLCSATLLASTVYAGIVEITVETGRFSKTYRIETDEDNIRPEGLSAAVQGQLALGSLEGSDPGRMQAVYLQDNPTPGLRYVTDWSMRHEESQRLYPLTVTVRAGERPERLFLSPGRSMHASLNFSHRREPEGYQHLHQLRFETSLTSYEYASSQIVDHEDPDRGVSEENNYSFRGTFRYNQNNDPIKLTLNYQTPADEVTHILMLDPDTGRVTDIKDESGLSYVETDGTQACSYLTPEVPGDTTLTPLGAVFPASN